MSAMLDTKTLWLVVAFAACSPPQVNDDTVEQGQGRAAPPPVAEPKGPVVCPPTAPAPDTLPGVKAEHRTAAYWIEKAKAYGDPDAVLFTGGELDDPLIQTPVKWVEHQLEVINAGDTEALRGGGHEEDRPPAALRLRDAAA